MFYTHKSLAMDIEDHPLASKFPKATEEASVHTGPETFRPFSAREGAPETIEEFIRSDLPQLSLHITSFNDATLVGLSWPHTLMDAMGQKALLHSWSLVLAGREADVPPLLGARTDVLYEATDAPEAPREEHCMANRRLRGLGMLMFVLRFLWDILWNRVEQRIICLPKSAVTKLREEAQSDLVVDKNVDSKESFVSEGDVLTAWGARAIASSLGQRRPVTVLQTFNARYRLPALIRAKGVYIQNMVFPAFVPLSLEAAVGSLGPIALANRRQLMEQTTESQILASFRSSRDIAQSGGDLAVVCGESNALLVPVTNWSRADFFNTADFSPALIHPDYTEPSRRNPPGTVVYHHAQSMRTGPTVRNVIVIFGKDHDDNYWLTGSLYPRTWTKIEEEIGRMKGKHAAAENLKGTF